MKEKNEFSRLQKVVATLLEACKHGAMSIHHPTCSYGKIAQGNTCNCHVKKCQDAVAKVKESQQVKNLCKSILVQNQYIANLEKENKKLQEMNLNQKGVIIILQDRKARAERIENAVRRALTWIEPDGVIGSEGAKNIKLILEKAIN